MDLRKSYLTKCVQSLLNVNGEGAALAEKYRI
jgi:hypothetical protein